MPKIKAETQEYKLSNEIAARAALLDFYGSRAVSFASLFIASIFGLVTMVPVTYDIEKAMFENGFQGNYANTLDIFILMASVSLFIVFAYVASYTFRMSSIYANIADRINIRGLERYGAEPFSGETFIETLTDKNDLEAMERAIDDAKREAAEALVEFPDKLRVKEEKWQDINLYIFIRIQLAKQRRFWLRRNNSYFWWLFPLLVFALASLAYSPILSRVPSFYLTSFFFVVMIVLAGILLVNARKCGSYLWKRLSKALREKSHR